MAQPSSFNITRDYLISNFSEMCNTRNELYSGISYTHFIPKPASESIANPSPGDFPIYECNCSGMQRDHRAIVERKLLRKVAEVFDNTKPLIVYSLGSGNCYQELSVCVQFAVKGYQVSQIVLVDKIYDKQAANWLAEFAVKEFSKFARELFPNVQISTYKEETEYLEEIKSAKQAKPDIILGIDVESSSLSKRQETYSKMLESSNNRAIFVYHNPKNQFNPSAGMVTFIDTIQGQTT